MENYQTKVKFKPFWILKRITALCFLLLYFSAFTYSNATGSDLFAEQAKVVNGQVTGENGISLPGVNVVIKGTTQGVITDINGNYSIEVPGSDVILVYTFIGFIKQEIRVGSQTLINVILHEDIKRLEEVVVIGYGKQKKETMVGAVSNVTSTELERTGGVTNLGQALTGQMAGLTTILSTGEPGADDPTILIRGQSTWNAAQPLVLVDGIERKMNDIDVNEVESISILKDASATAVFGVKGAEGVILVTTKRGRVGKPQLSAEANYGVKMLSQAPEKLDSYEGLSFRNKGIENELPVSETNWGNYVPNPLLVRYRKPQAPGDQYIFPNVDWPNEVLNDWATTKQVNVNINGGTNFARYFGSLGFVSEGDLLKTGLDTGKGYKTKWGYDRFNYRTNIDFTLTSTTEFTANLSGYVGTKYENYSTEEGTGSAMMAFTRISPSTFPARFPDGTWGYNIDFANEGNPLATLNNSGLEKIIRSQVNTDFKLNQKLDFITPGLSAQASLSYDNLFFSSGGIFEVSNTLRKYVDQDIIDVLPGGVYSEEAVAALPPSVREKYIIYSPSIGSNFFDFYTTPPSYLAEGVRDADYWNANNYLNRIERRLFYQFQLNYEQTFNKHDLTLLALMNREEYARGSMFPRYREDWVGRVTYNYDGKYLFETNAAYNGSEQFSSDYRFGFFPSVAVGWVASNENFLQFDWLDNLKFRYSWGKVGNDNIGAERWAYETTWRIETARLPLGYPTYGYSPYDQYVEAVIGNPELHWETAVKHNFGFELGVLDMFTLNTEIFKDYREGIFMNAKQRNIPIYFGAPAVAANLGETETTGFEVELKFQKTTLQGLNYWANLAYTRAIDEVIYMEDPELLPDYQKNKGFQIDQITSQLDAGFITSWDDVYAAPSLASNNNLKLPGDFYIVDFNGDGKIDSFDSAPYAYPTRPQNNYNLTTGIKYKGFSAHVQFYGVYNVTRSVDWTLLSYADAPHMLVYGFQKDYYTIDNPEASWRAPRSNATNDNVPSGSFFQFDGSYLRLKTAEVAYTFINPWLKGIGISSARIYLNGNNLLFWSDMPDDREVNDVSRGVNYPTYKRINLGVNVMF
ncbi:MAG: TonB-dependent receptor [Mariniphaga sp.]|nr:TonB-dependent receptor [Mariniphaga sp.]